MGLLGPLLSEQAPHHAQHNKEYIDKGEKLRSVLDDVVACRLDDSCVQGKTVECRNQVPVEEAHEGENHVYAQEDILPHEVVT
jgi:hypothetical protein